jgi:AraC-like DNA-binding protein
LDANPYLALNLLLRGGAMLLLIFIATSLLTDYPRVVAARLGALFALGVAAFALYSAPGLTAPPRWWQMPVTALNSGNMFVFWLFTRALLDDAFVLRPWHLAAWGILAAAGVLNCFVFVPQNLWAAVPTGAVLTLAPVLLAALSVAQSFAAWRGDLVEGRRRLRMMIVAATAGYSILMTFVALASGDVRLAFSSTANAFGLAALSLLIAWQLMRVVGGELFEAQRIVESAFGKEASAAEHRAITQKFEAPDPTAIRVLETLMRVENLYREESLSIGALANRMGLPEYKLRRLINQGLGFRNFNAFLNAYRIDEAKRALGDSSQATVPVLTIAMDAGFQSLGPFNRAFKAVTGMTPTEFRRMNTATVE